MIAQKLRTIWQIATAGRSLKSKMRLMIYVEEFHKLLAEDIEENAIEAGQVHTLQALRALVVERQEKHGRN